MTSNGISPLGWVLIVLLILTVVSLNISLITSLRHKTTGKHWFEMMQQTGKNMKDPFHSENEQMQELAKRVNHLKQTKDLTENNGKEIAGDQK